jgi:phosphomethylpyrimidine synthase
MEICEVPMVSVPVYEKAIETHAKDGVDFMTIHAGITLEGLRFMKNQGERGFWRLGLCRTYDVTISLGDSLRPGSIADSFDRPQIHEL